jgi:hypothetical protein
MAVVPHLGAPTIKKSGFLVTTNPFRLREAEGSAIHLTANKNNLMVVDVIWQETCQ